ncbi:AAA family ATPase [Aporhodopirellula aestuarii]|uniref:ATP-binding protein n=1 Tax=Aporhodopirellula aestuarii TaxID=2950107 RepID=A0ABT0TWK7_9BACT|nr:AAA family ATPase [Aporhodopirellula aestuarii]MCM2369019.1 ATP-binding protein [Aporhodopirellula aestuarii]
MANANAVVDSSLPNPFLGGIVPDAWRGATADVPEIHGDVYSQCLAAVQTVRTQQQSSSVLIHGEQGSGKTHLLARLQRRLTDTDTYPDLEDEWQIFVYLRMRTSSGRIWRKIRTELVTDLMRPMPDGLTQLDHVLAKRLATKCDGHADLALWWDHHREDRMEELIDAWHETAMQLSLRDDFTQVLEWFIRGKHRRHVRAYLGGGLVSEVGFRHLFGNVDASHYAPDNEDDAFAAVIALCHVAGPQIPIVFCFDQIEAIEVEDASHKPVWYLARAVADLTDEATVAAISCVLANFADNEIRAQDRARLVSGGQTALQRLDRNQMRQVIRSRVTAMAATAAAAGDNEHWPFADDEAMFASRSTPRELLHAAATRFDELRGVAVASPATDETPALASLFEQRVEDAIRLQKPEDTDDLIASTLPNLLSILEPGWTTEYPAGPHNSKRDIELVLIGLDKEARVGVALCNQPSMTSLAAQLKRLIENRNAFNLHKLVLIRDGRLPISPGAVATRKRLDQLTKDESVLVRPTREVMAVLDAVRSLIADATCGDLTLDGQAVAVTTVRQWLADHLDSVTREWVDQFCRPPRPGWIDDAPPDDTEVDAVLEYLEASPVASVDTASRATGVAESRIVELAGVASDRLQIVSGDPSVIFRVVNSTPLSEEGQSMQRSEAR